jgi:hypothetical protein
VGEALFDRVVNPLALTRRGTADIPSGNPPALSLDSRCGS